MDSCSWCGTMNAADVKVCRNLKCGHDAHVPRVDCGCYQCTCFPALQGFVMRGVRAQRAADKIIEAAKKS